ncbi:MFS transporter [Actinotalea sp. Marseille-Q4924]|uniref:MFS transporter n=1 Tax=Actinotalea sp. Marseille-Q4924 TaxID=2866571 RepID=UPI001CE4218E|nr:MFS transporter [Actinotalea sp. Marseille-Q4924]
MTERVSTPLRAATVAVVVVFVLNGFHFASWASRLPAVRDALELRPNQLGLLLLVGAIGSLVALPLSGMVVQRLGAPRTVASFAVLNVAGLLVAATAVQLGSLWLAGIGLVLFGVGTGVWDAAMNIEGAAVEQRLGRAIMPRFHAGFSFGTMAGAGLGAVAAWLGLPVLVHLGVVLAVSLAAVLWAVRAFLPAGTHDEQHDAGADGAAPRRSPFAAWTEPRTLLIGLVVLAAALTEGAANDWVSLAVVDGFGTSDAVGALGFAVFVTAMTGMRLLGTVLLDRWGRVPVLRLSAGLALAGLLVFGLVDNLAVALVGVVAWGLGAALGFPVGMSAASDDPRHAAARVAVVSTVGYAAFLAGPPLLGLLAEYVGYRQSLLAITIPILVGLLVMKAAAPLPTATPAATDTFAGPGVEPGLGERRA